LDLDGLRGWKGQEVDNGFVVDIDVRTPEEVFTGGVLEVGEDAFHGSREDAGLAVVSRLEEGKVGAARMFVEGGGTRPSEVFPEGILCTGERSVSLRVGDAMPRC